MKFTHLLYLFAGYFLAAAYNAKEVANNVMLLDDQQNVFLQAEQQFASDSARPLCNDYTEWSDYSECTTTCGGGSQFRTRSTTSNKGVAPTETTSKVKYCGVCPVDYPNPYMYGERCCSGNTDVQNNNILFESSTCTGNVVTCLKASNSGTCRNTSAYYESRSCNEDPCPSVPISAPKEDPLPTAVEEPSQLFMVQSGASNPYQNQVIIIGILTFLFSAYAIKML